jgi:hypothetical protein
LPALRRQDHFTPDQGSRLEKWRRMYQPTKFITHDGHHLPSVQSKTSASPKLTTANASE